MTERAGVGAVILTVVTLLGASCGMSRPSETPADGSVPHSHEEHSAGGTTESFDFGKPGDPEHEDRSLKVVALDTLRFKPARLGVNLGQTVTFFVTNSGKNEHEFVIGDRAFQRQHEKEMAEEHALMHNAGNAIVLPPGHTERLTWTFTMPGHFLYGCHVAGHYAAGMVGTIKVRQPS
jgi:uncharacterized cupredoxin-like copper-binding protein